MNDTTSGTVIHVQQTFLNKKHLKNFGPIRHCEPLHTHSPGVATVARRRCRMPPAHRCPRQRVTEGTAMAPLNGSNNVGIVEMANYSVKVDWYAEVLLFRTFSF